ncbi:hypothetical protein NBRC116188_29190 [Oceaniserpentilla sp. 4NH20-0058]
MFITSSFVLISLGYVQSETFNSVRAFVRGEGLWGKAQKDASFQLEQYAVTRSHIYYKKFQESLSVNLGGKQARLALLEPEPNIELARKGFLQGGNHPLDIDSLIHFFLRFEDFHYMKQAKQVWALGDEKISDLITLGEHIHTCIQLNDTQCLPPLLKELETLNAQLNQIAIEFSLVLSEGARWIKNTFMTISVIVIFLLALGMFFYTRRILIVIDKNEQELIISENRFLSLYNANVIGMMEWDVDGRILAANDAFLSMLGYSRNDLATDLLNWKNITLYDDSQKDKQAAKELAESGYCQAYEKVFIHKDGHHVPVYIGSALLQGVNNQGICFVIDQTLQKESETQLKLSATVFDASSDAMIIMDQNKHVIAANKAYCQLKEVSEKELLGRTPPILNSNKMPKDFYDDVSKALIEDGFWKGDIYSETKQGTALSLYLSINTVRDSSYRISHYVASMADISKRKNMEEQLKKLAHFDFLTGLANRSLYHDRLNHALSRAKRHHTQCALLFFDLDRFKPVNDQYGHEVGDLLLQEVAKRVRLQTRSSDTVARLGGDEFAIILEDIENMKHVELCATKLIQSISTPFEIKGQSLQIGCSIGISLYPSDGFDGTTLTRNADIAMYTAKGSGRNCYYFYNPANKSTA